MDQPFLWVSAVNAVVIDVWRNAERRNWTNTLRTCHYFKCRYGITKAILLISPVDQLINAFGIIHKSKQHYTRRYLY